MGDRYFFTSESVTEGHPDKIADQISDGILDELYRQDKYSRVACETMITTGLVIVSGEITTKAVGVDYRSIVRDVIRDIGYTDSSMDFDADTCGILLSLHSQSPDISIGVTEGSGLFTEQGAGDQGMMFGYACNETPELMPFPGQMAQRLVQKLAEVRKNGTLPYLRPDGKSQITVEYEDSKVLRVDSVVISTQHSMGVSLEKIAKDVKRDVILKVIPQKYLDADTKYYVNPTGRFVNGGPAWDTGLTGRKIIVDTYGGYARHGGGAFSGKDPTKVDRSASYMTRYAAKNVVAAGLAEKCEVQVAYAIGVAQVLSVFVDTFGTGKISDREIERKIKKVFDFTPKAIIDELDLRHPIYRKTAAYGHFGRELSEFTWEKTDKTDALLKA